MSGASIAAEVRAALQEVATEVGSGEFTVTLRVVVCEPTNPWETDISSETSHEVPAAVFDYPHNLVDGTLIRATDKRVMMATDVLPTTAMRLIIDGKDHAIESVEELNVSGVAMYYQVQARA